MPRTTNPEGVPSRWRELARRAAAVLATSALSVVPVGAAVLPPTASPAPSAPEVLPAFASPTATVAGHLLELTPSARRISPFVATDLSAELATQPIVGAVSVATAPQRALVVAARTASGHVLVLTSGANESSWAAVDVTTLGSAPVAVGTPAVVVDPSGVTRVFFRTASGDLDEVENDRPAPDPWFASDLTNRTVSTGGPTIAGDPVALSAPGFPTAVYARATSGDLVSFTLTSTPVHPWYFVDVSALAQGPAIVGDPAVTPAPDGFGLTAVYALASNGNLLEFTDDDAGYHLWSVRNVSASLHLPALSASPTALAGLPTEVADVTTTGHLLVASIPTVSLVGGSFQDVSALARQRVAPGHVASITAGAAGYAVAAVSVGEHVERFQVPSATATAATVDDLTMQPLTEQLAGADPTAVSVGGQVQLLVPSGGFVGLIPRIVLTATSQDQGHARVIDTPPGSECNPFTAAFGRGSTSGCAKGTAAEQWCSDFSQWVWQTAGVDTSGITGASKTFVTWGRARSQFLQGMRSTPAVGDAVVWGVLNPLWGAHVGIVIGVRGREIDVVSGNSGPYAVASAVWESGYFLPKTQLAQGDPIIGFVSPVPLPASRAAAPQIPSVWPRSASWPVVQGAGGLPAPRG